MNVNVVTADEEFVGCCCGNEFAVGPDAASHVHARPGFVLQEAVNVT